MDTTIHRGRPRKGQKFLPLLGTIVTSIRSVRTTMKAPSLIGCLYVDCLNPIANYLWPHCQIRHFHASFCWNLLGATPYQEEMLLNFLPSVESCGWLSHASSTNAQTAFRALAADLGCFAPPIKRVWNMYGLWPSMLASRSTFSA